MAQPDFTSQEPPPVQGLGSRAGLLRDPFLLDDDDEGTGDLDQAADMFAPPPRSSGIFGRGSKREVVPGIPRQKTFKRQQSELRDNLLPTTQSLAERRTVSVDRRMRGVSRNGSQTQSFPRASAPDLFLNEYDPSASLESIPHSPVEGSFAAMEGLHRIRSPMSDDDDDNAHGMYHHDDAGGEEPSLPDDLMSMTSSQYENQIHHELESIWILNLSMHFRDRSKREKFFVTYRQVDGGPNRSEIWRRVTVSLDYRDAPEGSLEWELVRTKFQRDKSAKIYDAIRESLRDIQFYETVTNLKLQTTDGRLHVHVVEDVNVSSRAMTPWHSPAPGEIRFSSHANHDDRKSSNTRRRR